MRDPRNINFKTNKEKNLFWMWLKIQIALESQIIVACLNFISFYTNKLKLTI